MKFYIYENQRLKIVSDIDYERWMETNSHHYILPEYSTIVDGTNYGLETIYDGAIDKGESVYPFILLYFEDIPTVKVEGIKINMEANSVQYFETFKELKLEYNRQLQEIQVKELLQ